MLVCIAIIHFFEQHSTLYNGIGSLDLVAVNRKLVKIFWPNPKKAETGIVDTGLQKDITNKGMIYHSWVHFLFSIYARSFPLA